MLTAELVKEGFLQQNAFSEHDSFCSPDKTYQMAKTLLSVHKLIQKKVLRQNFTVEDLQQEPWIEAVKRMSENDFESIKQLESEIFKQTELF